MIVEELQGLVQFISSFGCYCVSFSCSIFPFYNQLLPLFFLIIISSFHSLISFMKYTKDTRQDKYSGQSLVPVCGLLLVLPVDTPPYGPTSFLPWFHKGVVISREHGSSGSIPPVRTIALFTHFSLFFPFFCPLTHILLSRPVMILSILIFHPLPHACTCDIQPARQVSFFSLFSDHVINHLIAMCLPHGFIVTDLIAVRLGPHPTN